MTAAWGKSAWILCENNCGNQIQTDGRRFTKIRGDKEHVATAGYTCNKVLRLDHNQNGGARLTAPLRREPDGSSTPIDRDTAIREIAARLKIVRDTHGGTSIFFHGGGGQGNHLGGACSGALLRPRCPLPFQPSRPGEDRRGFRRRPPHRRPHDRRFRPRRDLAFPQQEPLAVPRARTVLKDIAKDPITGTPWHKHVPAGIQPLPT
ncbi:hypothetical protein OG698_45365 [Streptomyces sp. NBC_01003]|uniref:hypothetical protein n=1 Tax=Streptomyces sp. NBC_01003 TaxID=2903714 RepID=UPI00386B14FB|nr:hypothetical protein OG698_45365 [Streptomyces sp. NBC_01003]